MVAAVLERMHQYEWSVLCVCGGEQTIPCSGLELKAADGCFPLLADTRQQ